LTSGMARSVIARSFILLIEREMVAASGVKL
jgi:hypothetical protein